MATATSSKTFKEATQTAPSPNGEDLLKKRRDAVSWTLTIGHMLAVFGAVYVAAAVGPSLWLIPLWMWFGVMANALLNLMHGCAHRLVFRRRESSDLLGRWILGPLMLADFDGYRMRHWEHHKNLGHPGDTKDAYHVEIKGTAIVSLLVRCLFFVEGFSRLRHQMATPENGERLPVAPVLARIAIAQAILLSSVLGIALIAHANPSEGLISGLVAYGVVYVYGLTTLTVFVSTLRAVAEHQVGGDDAAVEGWAALRNFDTGWFDRIVFGAYGFDQHATHHRKPGVPHYRLADATSDLAKDDPDYAPRRGYLGTLRRLM